MAHIASRLRLEGLDENEIGFEPYQDRFFLDLHGTALTVVLGGEGHDVARDIAGLRKLAAVTAEAITALEQKLPAVIA